MSAPVIQVENLSKFYTLGRRQERHDTLRDALVGVIRKKWSRSTSNKEENTIWALKDVNFAVFEGQAIGIIGRNGAGKSTLLKILSRITEPTSGRALVTGRVGTLLEVGTGFHPELTGRENIYLYGAILGMHRSEITQKFNEIVAFAEIERFLETPIKRYSSGMYVRLAFSVAAHLDPEILFVDEVLAVGDVEFQKRCLGKMGDVVSKGKTVLFVSHNLNIIQRLCQKTILLEKGQMVSFGQTKETIALYIDSGLSLEKPETWIDVLQSRTKPTKETYFTHLWYTSSFSTSANYPYPDGPLEFRLRIFSHINRSINSLAVTIYDQYGGKLINMDTLSLGIQLHLESGFNEFQISLDQLHLNPGLYTVGLWMANYPSVIFDNNDQVLRLEVVDIEDEKFGVRPKWDGIVTNNFLIEKIHEK